MSLEINVRKNEDGSVVVALAGRLDGETSNSFELKMKQVLDTSAKALILDMSRLDYISSSGLGVIFQARKIIEAGGGVILLANLQPQIAKVFEIVKSLPKECVFENMEEVDRYLSAMQKDVIEKRNNKTKR